MGRRWFLSSQMFSIMKQKPDPRASEYLPGLRINSSQVPMVDNYLSTATTLPGKAVLIPSLNREARRRSYDRIMTENVAILERITSKKANYSVAKWERDRAQQETYLANISQDLTAGYLKQGANGRSIYFDPSATSQSMRSLRPISQQSRRSAGSRGSRRRATSSRRRRRKRQGGASAQTPLTSPIRTAGSRGFNAHDGGGLGDTGCLLAEAARPLGGGDRGTALLRVIEIPTLGGNEAGDAELATRCVCALLRVM